MYRECMYGLRTFARKDCLFLKGKKFCIQIKGYEPFLKGGFLMQFLPMAKSFSRD